MKVLFALCLLFLGSALAVRSHWNQLTRANPQDSLTIRFALTQQNLAQLETTLLDVADTTSKNYGKWWKPEDIAELVAPAKEVSESIVSFLTAQGATSVQNHRDSIKVVGTVSFVEELLQTSLFYFTHKTKSNVRIIRAVGSYAIPSEIEEHVEFVAGIYEFPTLRDRPVQIISPNEAVDSVDGYVVPYVLNNLYQIPANFPVHENSSICLAEFEDDQSYSKSDLKEFSKQNAIPEIVVTHVVGPFDGSDPDAEATLDVQYGSAIAQNTTVWYWTVAGWMYDFAVDLNQASVAPYVVSMSWGWPEPNQCDVGNCTGDETSEQYVERTNIEFQKIGLRGVTLLAASGDQGAPGDSNPDCSINGKKALSTIFPGASPWVLSVGATMLSNSTASENVAADEPPICKQYTCATSTTEEVCTYPDALITTGGGFSNYVAQPSYQTTVVQAYLKSGVKLPPSKDFAAGNRGFPDVSALGHNYLIDLSDQFIQVDGTSCSSPVFAAIIALLNSNRMNNNKAPLGFVVPLIYQAYAADPTTFTDITSGNNKCTENCCAKYGYEATTGWDPVTGLGTPVFPKLLKFVESLP